MIARLRSSSLSASGQEHVAHVLAQLGDEVEALRDQELLGQRLGDVALVAKEFAEEAARDQAGNWLAVVDVARRQTEGEQFAPVVDHQMEFEAIEPAHRGLAAPGIRPEDAMLVDARVVADRQRGRVDEADARAGAALGVQIDRERHQHAGHELDEAIVADQLGKLGAQVHLDILGVERLEGAVARLLEEDHDGHDLARMQPGGPLAPLRCPAASSSRSQTRLKHPPETHPPSRTRLPGRVYSC